MTDKQLHQQNNRARTIIPTNRATNITLATYAGVDLSKLPTLEDSDSAYYRIAKNSTDNEDIRNRLEVQENTIKKFVERNKKIKNDMTLMQENRVLKIHKEAQEIKSKIEKDTIKIYEDLKEISLNSARKLFSNNVDLTTVESSLLPQFLEGLKSKNAPSVMKLSENESQAKMLIYLKRTTPDLLPKNYRDMSLEIIDYIHTPNTVKTIKDNAETILKIEQAVLNIGDKFDNLAPNNVVEEIKRLVS